MRFFPQIQDLNDYKFYIIPVYVIVLAVISKFIICIGMEILLVANPRIPLLHHILYHSFGSSIHKVVGKNAKGANLDNTV